MNRSLAIKALTKLLIGLAVVMFLVFVPAGTLHYGNGWLFIALLFIPMTFIGVVLLVKDPALLEKRLDAKEEQNEQKKVVAISGAMFLLGFIAAGVSFRLRFLMMPKIITVIAAVLFILGYAMYAEVLRENTYLSRTVEVQSGQKVIESGLYGIVRHPMYSATIIMFLSMPLVLGSLVSFLIFLIYPAVIIKRISNEEKVLEEGLEGYKEYKQKVKYRLIPFIY